MSPHRLVFVLLALGACAHSGKVVAPLEPALPLKSVRLYETGIGYFERSGRVARGENLGLPVPSSHLDDALKTLVILGGDQKPLVRAIEFPTQVSEGMARSLASLPPSHTALGMSELLSSLKGAEVEIATTSGAVSGRVIEVIDPSTSSTTSTSSTEGEEPKPAPKPSELTVLLLTDQSQIRAIGASAMANVRPKDPARVARLSTALDALSSTARAQRLMRVLADSEGPVTLGYVAEAPLWRTTYRLVLEDSGKRGVLQAWALVHNDTEEDWSHVKVELVNGRPTSFLYPLAAPRYGRRELAHPEDDLSTVPQLMGKTPDALWGDFDEEGAGSTTAGALKSVTLGIGGMAASGRGAGGGGFGTLSAAGSAESSVLGVGNLAETAQATGTESGALFSYLLPAPLDLGSHGSALVPFLQQPVDLEVLAWLNAPGETAKAGVRLVNSTQQTLPAGPIATFAGGGLAGEGGLDRLKPAQHQIIEYGVDPDVEVRLKSGSLKLREQTRRLTFAGDRLQEHYLRTTESVYVVENRSGQSRAVYLALAVVDNAKVTGADALDYDAQASKPIAIWRLGPRQKVERAMKFEEGLSRPLAITELSSERLQQLSTCAELPEAERRAAADTMAAQKKVEETGKVLAKVQAEASKVEKDLERLEGHLRAMGEKSATPTGNPFVQRIVAAEDKLEDLRKKIEDLNATAEAQRTAVRDLLKKLGT